jgi:co-chaperonin GroES (HSP10)
MAIQINKIKGKPRAVGNRVLVTDMHFGEQKTSSGLIIKDDDGTTRGIYPRWAKVYDKGPENKSDYKIGHWILVEHGRWTRSFTVETPDGDVEMRMVETESVLGYAEKKPNDVYIGGEYADGEHATVDPSAFVNSSGALRG